MKINRNSVFGKYNGYCAYCGAKLEISKMQVDHIFPKAHKHWLDSPVMMKNHIWMLGKDIDDPVNLNPACRVCNKWKSTFTVEQFRTEIQSQIERLKKYSSGFRMAKTYRLIEETNKKVVFYFEIVGYK